MPKQFTVTLQCISWHLASLYPTDHVYSVDLVCRSLGFVQVLSFQVKFISIFSQETITLWTCRYGSLQCLRHCRTAGDTHMHITSHSSSLQWRHNERDSVSNHQPHDCLLKPLFRRRSKKTSKLRVTGLCVGNSPGTGEFSAQMVSYAENVSIWWRHHVLEFHLSCCVHVSVMSFRWNAVL